MKTRTNQPVVANGTPEGTISKVLGVDANGNIVKGEVSGGSKLYKHTITANNDLVIWIVNNSSTPFTSMSAIEDYLMDRSNYISASFTLESNAFIDIIGYNAGQGAFIGIDDMGTGLETYSFLEYTLVTDTITLL